ncbi:MAG: glycosyltransferase [Paraprevotella sp.]|nr:glycosyltransferase [Paraprevotella sp.]
MKKEPLVSVIIPNFNYGRYLEERIESVSRQTFTDFELILLDDASTDNSLAVMEAYRENPHVVHIEVNAQNTGSPFKQWMKGILLARGKYIWIAEADDNADPEFLYTCVHEAEVTDGVSVCFAGSTLFGADGTAENRDANHWGRRERKGSCCFDGKTYAEYNLYWKNYIINASGAIFRREYALRLSESPLVDMRYCGDWWFWFEMAMHGKVVEVYRRLNFFRQHAAKATEHSRRFGGGVCEDIEIVQLMETRLPGLSTYKKRLRRGLLYRKIKRLSLDEEQKEQLYSFLAVKLQGTMADYRLERRNQFLRLLNPFLTTARRDRL